MAKVHVLAAAARVWDSTKGEFEDKDDDAAQVRDGTPVPPEEIKKVTKYLQHTVTKFGASASVEDRAEILQPVGDEVVKAFTAAIGTLLSVRRGAGGCLRAELRSAGAGLAAAMESLGAAVGTPAMSINAGKMLDRIKHFERVPTHNRAAIRRRLLANLAQLRDAQREMREALQAEVGDGAADPDPLSDAESFFPPEEEMEPHERRLVEAICGATASFEELFAQVSRLCMPTPGGHSPGAAGPAAEAGTDSLPIPVLEVTVVHADAASSAVDTLANSSVGGVDVAECESGLSEMRKALDGLVGVFAENPPLAVETARERLDAIKEALEASAVEIAAETA